MTKTVNGYTFTAYLPQVSDWPDHTKLKAIMAMSILQPGKTTPVYGVVNLTADTSADVTAGTVLISNIQVASTSFPTLSADQQGKLDAFVKSRAEFGNRVLPLDTILLSLKNNQNAARSVKINTKPPQIFYSSKPAILVTFDGDPLFGPIKGMIGDLKFAINTNWNIFKSGANYYLLNSTYWLQAQAVKGPWKPAGKLPAVFAQLPNDESWKTVRAQLAAAPVSASQVPIVWIATGQAEAIVTSGAPKNVPIPNTSLFYIDNTDAALFYEATDKRYYYLTSGRWFATNSLSSGPWTFAGQYLPADFAKIPTDGPRGWVLASVPGTPQAQVAIGAASVPREASVSRSAATLTVTYAGDPQFKAIPSTTLQYAVNTSFDVLKVGDQYYACDNAVWFVSSSPNGPWAVAQSVPPDVYTIPSDQPLYNDTYVTVDSYDANSVLFGYTAGYLYSYPWYGGLYYGTGYWGVPWMGYYGGYPLYYGWPRTYVGGTYYNPVSGAYARGYGVYGPYGGAKVAAGYNPSTGNYFRGGAVYGPYGGVGHGTIYNPATGNYYHGAAAWGPNGIAYKGANGNVGYRGWGSASGAAASPYKNWGSAATMRTVTPTQFNKGMANANNIYAGRDGNVYRPSNTGNWQQYNNAGGGWKNTGATTGSGWSNPATRPSTTGTSPGFSNNTVNQLNRDNYARSAGYGGGGFRGGGGGFRGGGGRGR